jgi:hypothetical protein
MSGRWKSLPGSSPRDDWRECANHLCGISKAHVLVECKDMGFLSGREGAAEQGVDELAVLQIDVGERGDNEKAVFFGIIQDDALRIDLIERQGATLFAGCFFDAVQDVEDLAPEGEVGLLFVLLEDLLEFLNLRGERSVVQGLVAHEYHLSNRMEMGIVVPAGVFSCQKQDCVG